MIQEKMIKLNKLISNQSSLVTKMIQQNIAGLKNRDRQQFAKIIETDEPKVNKLELEIHKLCVSTIALFQPEAKYLRIIITALQTNNTIERMGDIAVNIAEGAVLLAQNPELQQPDDLFTMLAKADSMFQDSITAFINGNSGLAKQICCRDEEVDALRDRLFNKILKNMKNDNTVIDNSMHILKIAKDVERFADLATRIATDVVYMNEGKVIRHKDIPAAE
ncbi:MAG TPA: phosphate signaling complex protein PhoU [Spirochaetota bacterium]|nr:phosphate signaling complex protein PhoU [Spirochaetota bacterium]